MQLKYHSLYHHTKILICCPAYIDCPLMRLRPNRWIDIIKKLFKYFNSIKRDPSKGKRLLTGLPTKIKCSCSIHYWNTNFDILNRHVCTLWHPNRKKKIQIRIISNLEHKTLRDDKLVIQVQDRHKFSTSFSLPLIQHKIYKLQKFVRNVARITK